MRSTRLCTTALTSLALLFAACGGDDNAEGLDIPQVSLDETGDNADTASTAESQTANGDAAADGDIDGGDFTASDTGGAPNGAKAEELPVVSTGRFRTTGVDDLPVELVVAVNELRQDGNVVHLRFLLTNNGPNDYRPSIHLSDGALGTSADGISLIDYNTQKRYLTVIDEAGACVCTDFDVSDLKAGAGVSITATFPAPPDATDVDIQLGSLGVISGVPIQA